MLGPRIRGPCRSVALRSYTGAAAAGSVGQHCPLPRARAEWDPHQRKSEARQGHTRAVSAAVKLRPVTHQDAGFLLRKLLC